MAEQTHQLVAIMFSDIVGYTALMDEDEEKAFQILEKNRSIQKPIIVKHNGKLLKEMGDGVLASFPAVSDAVYCAKEIQDICKCKSETELSLRIGIHLGEVIVQDEDVFGSGVNIASRLEHLAPAGGIWVSESVHKNVINKKGIETKFVREETLKNVREPVRIYEIKVESVVTPSATPTQPAFDQQKGGIKKGVLIGGGIIILFLVVFAIYQYQLKSPSTSQTALEEELEKSIAVMPFDNESADEGNEYFVNGMMEDIRNNLSKISDLRVISKTSTEKYRTTTLSSQQIGMELSTNYLLEGTVQKLGNQLKIHTQLISTENDDHIWEDTYLRDITDIKEVFKIQSLIAQAIADELKAIITPEEKQLISAIPTENSEAYDLYLKGFFHFYSYTVDDFIQGLIFFERAIELDSNFALAYSGVALSYIIRSSVFGDLSSDEAYKNAMPYLNKALDLNPELSEAHLWLGYVKFYFLWDFNGGEEEYLKAIKLRPTNSSAIFSYVNFLNNMERHEEAINLERKGMQIDPFQIPDPTLFWLGRIDEAIQFAKERVNLIPNPLTYSNLGFVLLNTGSYQEAINAQQKALELAGRRLPRMLAWLAAAYAKNGQENKAVELLNELKEIREQSLAGSPAFYIAVIYSALDEKNLAFQWLEQAYEDHDMEMVWLKTEPQLYPLNDDPRFQDLLKRVGFDVSG